MSNSITLAQSYAGVVDEVYQLAATSTVLNSDQGLASAGANAKEIKVPKVSVTGLGDYTRNSGYTQGNVTLAWETVEFDYDRGTKITVDAMDATETGLTNAFTVACAELQRTQVAPESDAYTYAKICAKATDLAAAGVTYSTGADVLAAISAAMTQMDEAQVPSEGRYLFITPTLARMVRLYQATHGDTADTQSVWSEFAQVVEVPQARFYTAIDLLPGTVSGGFGYQRAAAATGRAAGADINFLIVEKSAVIKFDKHVASRVFSPDELEDLDSYMQKYRKYGIVEVFDNKAAGCVVSHKAAPTG